jgi:hypothetical protein
MNIQPGMLAAMGDAASLAAPGTRMNLNTFGLVSQFALSGPF